MLLAQIGLLVIAVGLLGGGIWGLLGFEDSRGKKTHPGVAVTLIVVALIAAGFALLVVPRL